LVIQKIKNKILGFGRFGASFQLSKRKNFVSEPALEAPGLKETMHKKGIGQNKLNKFGPNISARITATPKDQRTRRQPRGRLSRAPGEHLPRKSRGNVSRKMGPRTIVEYMVAPTAKLRSGLPPVDKLSAGQMGLAGAAPSATAIAASTDDQGLGKSKYRRSIYVRI